MKTMGEEMYGGVWTKRWTKR